MNRSLMAGASVLSLLAPASAVVAASVASPAGATSTCTSVTTSHGQLTAALVDPTSTVSGTVTPTGCDIGVYTSAPAPRGRSRARP